MDQLFAPWRIEWVARDDDQDAADADDPDDDRCPFCALPERDDDRESKIVARSPHSFVLLNNYPYAPGHVMVIPYRHTGEFAALSDAELLDHARLKSKTLAALDAAFDPDGCNAGENLGGSAAGGSIDDHLHTHVVPRWSGDTNFMPVISDTKVLVQALDDSYDQLREAFAGLDGAVVDGDDDAVHFELD
ncbi:histidine triad family protein (homolog to bis(5'-nucleosyl)-tetraphosphatase) [Haloferax gibbonsii]|uniref:Histidine triad family protein (Homolog to bis(5'-nucleosyl)-tetraphosphatase) n=1 Tax=Haloferax gibbonsii TaxID=35746 RepID=A0A871BGW2_HALGI|nr:HIT domain-containing protein [Haloferax gibbonsii]QOS12222.1 histidine triad family protein (homolog to bis(5'-nucleosyl)-tetraphosphatase) [Haloferax gibbonsii]